jgi:hypothetical protein
MSTQIRTALLLMMCIPLWLILSGCQSSRVEKEFITEFEKVFPTIPDSLTKCAPPPEQTYPRHAETQLVIAEWVVQMNKEYKDCTSRLDRAVCIARGDCLTGEN